MPRLSGRSSLLPWLVLLVPVVGCSDRVEPPPARIRYIDLDLPPGASDYLEHESGIRGTLLQVRFDLPRAELDPLEKRLPCRLGDLSSGAPAFAGVGTNDRPWYTRHRATAHRGCDFQRGLMSASFLVDLSQRARARVYVVVGLD